MSEMNDWNKRVIEEFRANEGKVGGNFANSTLLLLHTRGAKSGLPRINPLMYLADDERYVIVASKGGAPTSPDWYHNLITNPEVSVEVGTEQFEVLATVAAEPERTQMYEKVEAVSPGFTAYKHKTTRVIPIIILTRRS